MKIKSIAVRKDFKSGLGMHEGKKVYYAYVLVTVEDLPDVVGWWGHFNGQEWDQQAARLPKALQQGIESICKRHNEVKTVKCTLDHDRVCGERASWVTLEFIVTDTQDAIYGCLSKPGKDEYYNESAETLFKRELITELKKSGELQ